VGKQVFAGMNEDYQRSFFSRVFNLPFHYINRAKMSSADLTRASQTQLGSRNEPRKWSSWVFDESGPFSSEGRWWWQWLEELVSRPHTGEGRQCQHPSCLDVVAGAISQWLKNAANLHFESDHVNFIWYELLEHSEFMRT
jgi:hypothetical protein